MANATDLHDQHNHREGEACLCRPATVSVEQTLDELDFERGIWSAAIYNDISRIKDFISKGDTDRRDNGGYTALHYAARNGHKEICRLLINGGCDVNAKTKGGATALHRAAMMDHLDIIKLLLLSHAKVEVQDEDGQTPLHRSAAKGSLSISKELVQTSEGLKLIRDRKGRIPYDLVPTDREELKIMLSI